MVDWSLVPGIAFGAAVIAITLMVVILARRQRRMDTAAGYSDLPQAGAPAGPPVSAYLLCYVLFFVLLALSVAVFFGWTQNIQVILAATDFRWEINRLVYMMGMAFVGLFLFVLVAAAEPYLRGGVAQENLARRFLRLMLVLGGFWLVGFVVRVVAQFAI
jgi:hypothetical protein